jgi:hypothetical protein
MTWGGHVNSNLANPNSADPICAELVRVRTPRREAAPTIWRAYNVGSGNLENLSGSVVTGLRGRNFPAGAPHPICFWQAPAGAKSSKAPAGAR